MALTQLDNRRQLGIYYTPNTATRILCSWAIRSAEDVLLEPSFGACGFLEASCNRLHELACANPAGQLYGCDIDDNAFVDHLWRIFGESNDLLERFKIGDFLSIKPEDFDVEFDAVIGNPPYISHHRMSDEQKANNDLAFAFSPLRPNRRADLWVYFVLHSLRFLKRGGRMAWILPGSFLHSDYSISLRKIIEQKFERSLAIQLGQKLFIAEGAQENTIVLLADGYDGPSSDLRLHYAPALAELREAISRWEGGNEVGQVCGENIQEAFLSQESLDCLRTIQNQFRVASVGDFCDVKIGIVTGANPFFLLNSTMAEEKQIPNEFLRPIVRKFEMVKGLQLTPDDLVSSVRSDFPCLLVNTAPAGALDNPELRRYLDSFDPTTKAKNKTLNKRSIWHQPDDGYLPDAFLSYMHGNGPRLALNVAATTCTNTVHRVYFRVGVGTTEQQAIALALQSTYGQLCAELEGRAYGSGVLKHEPSGARRIRLMLPRDLDSHIINTAFENADCALRSGNMAQVKAIADECVMGDMIVEQGRDVFERTVSILDDTLRQMRARRHHHPK